jgi:hypothetical protein
MRTRLTCILIERSSSGNSSSIRKSNHCYAKNTATCVLLHVLVPARLQDDNFPASLGNDHSAAALHCKMLLMDLLRDVRKYLVAHRSAAGSGAVQHVISAMHLCIQPNATLQDRKQGWRAAAV